MHYQGLCVGDWKHNKINTWNRECWEFLGGIGANNLPSQIQFKSCKYKAVAASTGSDTRLLARHHLNMFPTSRQVEIYQLMQGLELCAIISSQFIPWQTLAIWNIVGIRVYRKSNNLNSPKTDQLFITHAQKIFYFKHFLRTGSAKPQELCETSVSGNSCQKRKKKGL